MITQGKWGVNFKSLFAKNDSIVLNKVIIMQHGSPKSRET